MACLLCFKKYFSTSEFILQQTQKSLLYFYKISRLHFVSHKILKPYKNYHLIEKHQPLLAWHKNYGDITIGPAFEGDIKNNPKQISPWKWHVTIILRDLN